MVQLSRLPVSKGGWKGSLFCMQSLLSQLNDHQREAVTYCDGPQLVIAGAGAGKTRVLTYKIAWLLEHYDLKPWSILALTFTNKAANEMKARIGQLVGNERARYLQMGTFHSVFSHILRVEAAAIDYRSDFTIYDESDSRSLIKNIVKQMGLDDKTYKPSSVHGAISMAKNRLVMPDDYAENGDYISRDRYRNMPETFKIYAAYQQRLRQANAMDFDDLLVLTFRLLHDHADICRKYVERFQYVLVDEYQDTNYVQQQIVWLLTKERKRICVVGDDYQSIYAFRGANIENILNFRNLYGDAQLFKLEQNYRSTQSIVAAANSLMKHNERQIPKEVFSENDEGEKVTIMETISDKREAAMVCREIKRIKSQEGARWSDFAILYRTNAQSRTFEEEMRKPEVGMGQCYRIFGGLSFYQRKEIKDVIAYFRLVVNPDDEEAFRRVINYPTRGIGGTTLQKVVEMAQHHQVSLWEVISQPVNYGLDVNKGALTKLIAFRELINSFIVQAANTDALTLGNLIIERTGIKADLASDKTAEGDSRRQNLDGLISGIADFVQGRREDGLLDQVYLSDYLSTVSLMSDQDGDDGSDDKVTLMTIHSAKGLEFPTVFVVGLEENIFPSLMSVGTPREIEEERRLLYVAITRAEKHCFLSWAHSRWQYGKMDSFVNPSRFLNDIDPKYTTTRVEGGSIGNRPRRLWGDDDMSERRPWEDYESDRPYTGQQVWGSEYPRRSSRMQNSRPVAGQFMADAKPKITAPRQQEKAVNPLSPSLEAKLKQGGHWKNVSKAMTNGGRTLSPSSPTTTSTPTATDASGLREGAIIEHQRFGKGTVVRLEGTGENRKATVNFEQTGQKQLLLKFAKFTVVG